MHIFHIFQQKSIQMRIVFLGGLCILLISGSLIMYSVISVRSLSMKAAEREAQTAAEAQARVVASTIGKALYSARTLAQSFAAMKTHGL
jgi:hypothetical protein